MHMRYLELYSFVPVDNKDVCLKVKLDKLQHSKPRISLCTSSLYIPMNEHGAKEI